MAVIPISDSYSSAYFKSAYTNVNHTTQMLEQQ